VTVRDFVWWSGLTVGEARRALESVTPALRQETIGSDVYWSTTSMPPQGRKPVSPVLLLPNYDEYFIAYRDRGPIAPPAGSRAPADPMDAFAHLLCVDGRFGGVWRRTIGRTSVAIELAPLRPLGRAHRAAAETAAAEHAAFLGLALELAIRPAR
jgi:hypothetical protein